MKKEINENTFCELSPLGLFVCDIVLFSPREAERERAQGGVGASK